MTKAEIQILNNQIAIMEALVTIFHQSGDYGVACRNLELRLSDTWESLRIRDELTEECSTNSPQKFAGGWIPCSERLPETDDYVLCWYEYRVMQGTCEGEMRQTYGIGYYLKTFNNWGGEVSYGRDCQVIAWMPLPAPYTEGE